MQLGKITDAELEVLKILWKHPSSRAKDIVTYLQGSSWNEKTIRTLLHRLVVKEIVSIDKSGKEFLYASLVAEEKYTEYIGKSLANKLFEGSLSNMILNFLGDATLSQKEVQELKNYLGQYDK